MLTRTGKYALRALIHLTRNEKDRPIAGRHIAERTGIPAKYLSTILSRLVRTMVLISAKGLRGSCCLVLPTQKTFVLDILEPFEPAWTLDRARPFGNAACNNDVPCLRHEAWQGIREGYYTFPRKTSIFDVSIGQVMKKRRSTRTKSRP